MPLLAPRLALLTRRAQQKGTRLLPKLGWIVAASGLIVLPFTWLFAPTSDWQARVACGMAVSACVFSEAKLGTLLGRKRLKMFGALLILLSTVQIASSVLLVLLFPNVTSPLLGLVIANVVVGVVIISIESRARTLKSISPSGGLAFSGIGIANLALWILASGDRVVLGHDVFPARLASYAITYGIIDRFYRTISTAEVNRTLGASFEGVRTGVAVKKSMYLSIVGCLVVSFGLLIHPLISLLTGGRYGLDLSNNWILVLGISLMALSAPLYVKAMAFKRGKEAAIAAILAATIDIVGDIIFVPHLGVLAACIFTLLGYGVWILGLWILIRKR